MQLGNGSNSLFVTITSYFFGNFIALLFSFGNCTVMVMNFTVIFIVMLYTIGYGTIEQATYSA